MNLSKAFDTVPRTILIQKIFRANLCTHLKKWLASYLKGRPGSVKYNGAESLTKRRTNNVLYCMTFPLLKILAHRCSHTLLISPCSHNTQDQTQQSFTYKIISVHWINGSSAPFQCY